MPDGDRFRLGLSLRWVRVQRSLQARDAIERTADLVVKALAADLRRTGGVGDSGNLVGAARQRARSTAADTEIADSQSMANRQRMTLALAMAASDHLLLISDPQATQALVRRSVTDAALDRLDRMVRPLVGRDGYTAGELYQRFQALMSSEQMARLCERLLRNPSAKGLRAPSRRFKPLRGDDFLNAELDSL